MSTAATTSSSVGPAPWRSLFLQHIENMPSPEFVLATLAPVSKDTTSDPKSHSTTSYLPRARFCIYRGLFTQIPYNSYYNAKKNPEVYDSDMLTFTTDVRMEKVHEIFASSAGHGDVSQSQGSGGGGPVEAVFWAKENSSQWRFKGTAYVIGPDAADETGEEEQSSGVRTAKSELGKRMRVIHESKKDEWSWGTEVNAHFENLSPGMRGSFKNPPPGSKKGKTGEGEELGQKVTKGLAEENLAQKNFRVVVIKPDVVECCDLATENPMKAHRQIWTFVGEKEQHDLEEGEEKVGEWIKKETWP